MKCEVEDCEEEARTKVMILLEPPTISTQVERYLCWQHSRSAVGADPRGAEEVADEITALTRLIMAKASLPFLSDWPAGQEEPSPSPWSAAIAEAVGQSLPAALTKASEPLRLAILVNQKVQPFQYESAEVSLHLGNLTLATPDEEIDALLERGRLAYDRMAKDVGARAKGARDKGGFA